MWFLQNFVFDLIRRKINLFLIIIKFKCYHWRPIAINFLRKYLFVMINTVYHITQKKKHQTKIYDTNKLMNPYNLLSLHKHFARIFIINSFISLLKSNKPNMVFHIFFYCCKEVVGEKKCFFHNLILSKLIYLIIIITLFNKI